MPRLPLKDEIAMRNAIDEYLKENVMTTIKEIQDYVEEKTGNRPASSTISTYIASNTSYKKVWVKE